MGRFMATKFSAPELRVAAGAVPLSFFVESLQQPYELLSEAIDCLGIGEALIRRHGCPHSPQ